MHKGFTLIELLIVIGILAILATVVVLVLNPAEILAQARDSQRISDLGSVKSAVSIYLATATSTALTAGPFTTASTTCGFSSGCPGTIRNIYLIDGTGWAAVDLRGTSGGSALAALPADPLNTATYQYAWKADAVNKLFEIDGRLESNKFRAQMTTEGGDANNCTTYTENTCWYEVGTSLTQ